MTIEQFNKKMQAKNGATPLFEALRKLRQSGRIAEDPRIGELGWPSWDGRA